MFLLLHVPYCIILLFYQKIMHPMKTFFWVGSISNIQDEKAYL